MLLASLLWRRGRSLSFQDEKDSSVVGVLVVLVVQVPQVQFLDIVVFMPVVGLHGPDSAEARGVSTVAVLRYG